MIGKSYLNKVVKEGLPYFIYLLSVLAAAAVSEVGIWTTILMLNAVITVTTSLDFGRNQMIIARLSMRTLSVGVYALGGVILLLVISRINNGTSLGLLSAAVVSGLFTVYLQHAASLRSVRGEDGKLQMLNIFLSVSRSVGIMLAAWFGSPVVLFGIYGLGLIFCLWPYRIQFDLKMTGVITSKNELAIAIVSVVGLVSFSLDKIVYYSSIDSALVKPYSIISMLFMGAMFLSALWYRMHDSNELNPASLYRLIVLAYIGFSFTVFIGAYIYQINLSRHDVFLYAAIMSTWGWLNISSQRGYKRDYGSSVYMPRLFSVAIIPFVVLLIYLLKPENAVVMYWAGVVISQFAYFLIKKICGLGRKGGNNY